MVHYHADTEDIPWPGPLDADCHAGQGLASPPPTSPQMQRLLDRYGAKNEKELKHAIRRSYLAETEELLPMRVIDVILDQMLEAEYQRIEGGAYD